MNFTDAEYAAMMAATVSPSKSTASPESGDPMNATARTIRKENKVTAAAAIKATVTEGAKVATKATRKPRAPKTVTHPSDAVDLERLADMALTAAVKAEDRAKAITEPRRSAIAWEKVEAFRVTANARAIDAGRTEPFTAASLDEDADLSEDEFLDKHASRDDGPDNVGPQPEDDPSSFVMPRMTKAGRVLMDMIGRHQFTWFDEGIAVNSGIWHQCLTDEATGAPGLPEKPLGVAQVIRGLGKAGLLSIDEQGEDGVWVALTADGAQVALALAAEGEPTDPPVHAPSPKVTPTPKAKVTPVAKVAKTAKAAATVPAAKVAKTAKPKVAKVAKPAPAPVAPKDNPKVLSLRDYGATQGWTMTLTADGASVVVTAKRAKPSELLTVTFIDGKMDMANVPTYTRSDGSVVLLRNVSAVKKQMDSDLSARPVKATRSTGKVSRKHVAKDADPAIRSLPFDSEKATDAEIAKAVSGSTVTWRMTDGTVVTAISGKKVGVKAHPRKAGAAHRVVSFFAQEMTDKGLVAAGERFIGIDMMLTVESSK